MRPDILIITVNGSPAPWAMLSGGRLMSFELNDKAGIEADSISIELSDHDGRLAIPTEQAEISVAIDGVDKGIYIVDKISHSGSPDTLTIGASSAEFAGKFAEKRTESYDETTVAEVIEKIAGRHGWSHRVSDKLANRRIRHIDQTEESDANLLNRLAERYDAIGTVKNKTLLFIKAGEPVSASGEPIPPLIITRQSGDGHDFNRNDRTGRHTGVKAFYQTSEKTKRQSVTAGEEGYQKQLRATYPSQAEAQDAADAAWDKLQRSQMTFSLSLARGVATAMPHTPVTLAGWKSDITAQSWVVDSITHNIDSNGYTVEIELQKVK